ncbi:tRNA1(Val) (adenine(37)-N6)-methyltransferase [Dehalobacterium formicoaceticum]|uniref:tRNA1(Val) (Adenine(37)-N6)-methyltransferase n=1 Tax=Dehalobacterium formicoaceticum TaxID=51515 RepID=A0ABT1Y442_9FIRM|nr:tRNA1(Val) (adenine(37)-N6)-methyltransferase [Dehalobacterium formicoaceticum]
MGVVSQSEERIDDLLWRNLKIIQNPNWFCFSLDAVLLADFLLLRPGDRVVDLGTGTGVIPLLLAARLRNTSIIGLELKEEVAHMAERSVSLNNLNQQITIKVGDIKEASAQLGKGSFDLVVSNPPYAPMGTGKISLSPVKAAARTEVYCSLKDVIREGAALLNSEGRFALVHRPARLGEIISLMRDYRLEPKRMRFVHPMLGREPNILMIEGIKNGKRDVHILPPLFIYQKTGVYSEEMAAIFQGKILKEEW